MKNEILKPYKSGKNCKKKPALLIALISAILSVLVLSFFIHLHVTEWAYKEYALPLIYVGISVFLSVWGLTYISRVDN